MSDTEGITVTLSDSDTAEIPSMDTEGESSDSDGLDPELCQRKTCADLGWACGYTVVCGEVLDCADEGLECGADELCVGGVDAPTECVAGMGESCELCSAVPDCSAEPAPTRLRGRVISPGRDDEDVGNQVGVPNAIVYILRTIDDGALPEIESGIPTDGESCDRCEDRDLGPVLAGTVTDAHGEWELEEQIPVGVDFLLVVQAGKFRRATTFSLPDTAACETTELPETLPDNPTRLPRAMNDGLGVHIPRIAVSTGQIDAIECVFEKMGLDHGEFGNPDDGAEAPRLHLYRGGSSSDPRGARIDGDTPHDTDLYGDLDRLHSYDMVIADCEGQSWDSSYSQRDDHGDHVREFVNRGGRLFASHLSHTWINGNGDEPYSAADPYATGLDDSADWQTGWVTSPDEGPGRVSLGRDQASPRIQGFADWMIREGVIDAEDDTFEITDPRSQARSVGDHAEEFVYCDTDGSGGCNNYRPQQLSFSTPYGAPDEAACGRVSYSGFHVVAGGGSSAYQNATFPNHCDGDLSDQEKVLLYMLFDLGACVGVPEPPAPPDCTPIECGARCGFNPDGCGAVLDCGPCPIPG